MVTWSGKKERKKVTCLTDRGGRFEEGATSSPGAKALRLTTVSTGPWKRTYSLAAAAVAAVVKVGKRCVREQRADWRVTGDGPTAEERIMMQE